LGLSFDLIANLGSMLVVLDHLGACADLSFAKPAALVIFAGALAAHYVYFIRSGRYLQLHNEFQNRIGPTPWPSLAAWAYIIGSPLLFFALAFVGASFRAA